MSLDGLDDADLLRLRDSAQQLGLTLEVGTASTQAEHLARFVEIARLLGAHILRVVEDKKDWQPSSDDIVAALRTVLPACQQHDVTIALENHTALSIYELARIVRTVNDPHVGICLDTVNSVARLEGWREVVDTLCPYAVSLHLKDAIAQKRGVGFYISGAPLGQGLVDCPDVVRRVQANERDANVLLEFWMDYAGDMSTTLRQEEQWIVGSLAYLRQIVR
jgi:sugar phosphate isomerase/epimerase